MMQLHVVQNPQGLVIYDGPSKFDHSQIIVIVTGFSKKTENRKTGNMLQSWILRKDVNPIEAFENKDDDAICGNCKHRAMRTCYVNIHTAPYNIWFAYHRGSYHQATPNALNLFYDRIIRIGAYGDPAVVPTEIWRTIIKPARGWTSYSHAWKESWCDPELKHICMASCDTEVEVEEALARKWMPFYARPNNLPLLKGSFVCPASKEGGQRLQCNECMACHGGEFNGKRGYPSIIVHGSHNRIVNYHEKIKPYIQLGIKRKKMRETRALFKY